MAVTQANLTRLNNWLLDDEHNPGEEMVKTFNTSSYWFDESIFARELAEDPSGGRQFRFPLQSARYTGFGGRGDGSTLASARDAVRQQVLGNLVNHYQRARFTGPAKRRSRGDLAFFEAVSHILSNVPKDFSKFMGQVFMRDGSGAIARVDGDPSGTTTLTLDDCSVAGGMGTNVEAIFGTQHMHAGQEIDYWSGEAAAGSVSANVGWELTGYRTTPNPDTVVAVTSTAVATVNENDTAGTTIHADVADGDFVSYTADSTNDTAPQEATGLLAHVSRANRTVYGINKSTSGYYGSAFDTGAHGDETAFSLDHLDVAVRSITNQVGPSRIQRLVALCTPALGDNIATEMKDLVRFTADDFDLKWGYSTLAYVRRGVRLSIVEDDDCACGAIFYLDPRVFTIFQAMDPQILSDDGLTFRNVVNVDAWEMMYGWDLELACINPSFTGLRKGYTET